MESFFLKRLSFHFLKWKNSNHHKSFRNPVFLSFFSSSSLLTTRMIMWMSHDVKLNFIWLFLNFFYEKKWKFFMFFFLLFKIDIDRKTTGWLNRFDDDQKWLFDSIIIGRFRANEWWYDFIWRYNDDGDKILNFLLMMDVLIYLTTNNRYWKAKKIYKMLHWGGLIWIFFFWFAARL